MLRLKPQPDWMSMMIRKRVSRIDRRPFQLKWLQDYVEYIKLETQFEMRLGLAKGPNLWQPYS